MRTLTLNQIMVLLDCARGTYDVTRHMDGAEKDCTMLSSARLIRMCRVSNRWEVTSYGEKLARHIVGEGCFMMDVKVGNQHTIEKLTAQLTAAREIIDDQRKGQQ